MSFALELDEWVEKAKGNLDRVTREALMLATQGVVMRSPVDTGRFRANWQFGAGAIDFTTSDQVDPSGAISIAKVQAQLGAVNAGGVYYLTNSLPYAYRLEYEGWSAQAPAGMVRVTLAGLQGAIDDYVANLA